MTAQVRVCSTEHPIRSRIPGECQAHVYSHLVGWIIPSALRIDMYKYSKICLQMKVLCLLLLYSTTCYACEGNFEGVQCDRCVTGWTGSSCDIVQDDCGHNPCMHGGICHNMLVDYYCECSGGFWGKQCQVQPHGNRCVYESEVVDLLSSTIGSSEVRRKCSHEIRTNCFV